MFFETIAAAESGRGKAERLAIAVRDSLLEYRNDERGAHDRTQRRLIHVAGIAWLTLCFALLGQAVSGASFT